MIFGEGLRARADRAALQAVPLDRLLTLVRRPLARASDRRALALDSLSALSADVATSATADSDAPGQARPRVLVASLRGWPSHNAYELIVAQALRLRGAEVALLTCGGGMPACESGWARRTYPRPCDRCAWLTDRVAEAAGLHHYALRDFLPWGRDARRAPAEPAGNGIASRRGEDTVNPHDASAVSVAWLLKASQPDRVPEAPEVANDFAVAASGVGRAAEAILEEFEPDVVLLLNGLFGAERAIREVAIARGIRTPTYEIAPRGGALVFSQDTPAPAYDVDELWTATRDRPLSDRQHAEIMALLEDRARGVGAHESYYDSPENDPHELRRRLGLNGHERVVSLFTNVTWDSATIGHDIGFASMFDWVEHAVRSAAEHEDLVLVVRVHPGEVRWGTREGLQEVVTSRLGEVPANLRFVAAGEALSSYTLIDLSDLLLTYTTTVGLEAAARGKHVAVAGDTHYRGRGFTTDVAGPEDLARVLGRQPEPLSAQNMDLAIRYAHMFFFRAMIPFTPAENQGGRMSRVPRMAAEIAPGADPYLDWVCERILDGGHFGLPDELAKASR